MELKDKRIFIVEDNIHNRVVYTMALKLLGVTLEFDRWGRNTLYRMKAFREIDLIILDLMLPGADSGYDIFDHIRADRTYDHVPVIAVSASEPTLAMPIVREKGFSGFIAKPIDVEVFPEQLKRILAGESIWYAGERYQGAAR